jgi:hypothetical protein
LRLQASSSLELEHEEVEDESEESELLEVLSLEQESELLSEELVLELDDDDSWQGFPFRHGLPR